MDFTKIGQPQPAQTVASRFDLRAFAAGIIVAFAVSSTTVVAFDFGGIASSVKNLVSIKKNLDNDVKNLTADAKLLLGSKDKLLQIKDALFKLANDTKNQIDLINALVSEVDGHLKKTQSDIQSTAKNVGEIDNVRKALSGKK